jgi:hypothetical protein
MLQWYINELVLPAIRKFPKMGFSISEGLRDVFDTLSCEVNSRKV